MKIGVYGGTFSPIHAGHIKVAKSFLTEMALDKLYVIPTCLPPHKDEIEGADAEDRLEMCRLAFDGEEKISVSDIEIKRRGKSYTVDTLRALKDEGELYLLCGSDMFLTLESWREADEIFKLAGIVLGRRENDALTGDALEKHKAHLVKDCGARVFEIEFDAIELSSSEIRERIRLLRPIKDELLPSVRDYIYENGLYRDGDMPLLSNVRERVRTMMGKRRFLHTLGVEREINFLAGIYCPEKREKLRLAALLHDITKE
ncbi:MAG: nicotinate (nicotinamide) nucleotide adenylyltransferase, partial [Clostridia bacterium]|nr:nicotinate (nicotinamide) nucleotide adenylyltransferase [Clostridia bacterium]